MGQKDCHEPVDIATFFRKSNTTFGLTEMFKNESYLDKMKLKVIMKNIIIYTTNDEVVSLHLVNKIVSLDRYKDYNIDIFYMFIYLYLNMNKFINL